MKRSLLMGFRALVFALAAFALFAVSGIKVRAASDVALFILGLVALWIVAERVLMNIKQKKRRPPGA